MFGGGEGIGGVGGLGAGFVGTWIECVSYPSPTRGLLMSALRTRSLAGERPPSMLNPDGVSRPTGARVDFASGTAVPVGMYCRCARSFAALVLTGRPSLSSNVCQGRPTNFSSLGRKLGGVSPPKTGVARERRDARDFLNECQAASPPKSVATTPPTTRTAMMLLCAAAPVVDK